ncbi:MAG: serine/threonine-protein phosphatase [Spirochaetales bacterium]|nr:serine/threonine-protein phosphatase [Spirochaetales bacterium]
MKKQTQCKLIQRLRSSMAFNIIGVIILILNVFAIVVASIGYASFTSAFLKEYSVTTYHMADTATTLVNGDHLDEYISGQLMEEYQQTKRYLAGYCKRMAVSIVYVIRVDQSDYNSFYSVFNLVNNDVDKTEYTAWELGYQRATTNDEYRQKYIALYNREVPYETIYRTRTTDGQHPHITTMVPVKNSAGEVSGLLCIQRPMSEINNARFPYLITIAVGTVLLVVIASFLAVTILRKRFIKPLHKVSVEASRFAKENTKGESLSGISRYRELSELANSIDTMETDMVTYIDNLTAATVEKEKITAELSLAHTIQINSIPNTFPAFPDRTDFDIYGSMDPAKDVGGDFYNFFFVDDDHLALVIGDVSGKGIPAALFMMVTNILIRDRAHMGSLPSEILKSANSILTERNPADMFVTVWLGILELSTGKLVAANAGHEYPAIRRAGGGFELFKDKHGFVIGGMADISFKDYELQLSPGDKLFVYTDGVPEATSSADGMFGTQRMLGSLNTDPEASPEQVLKNVRIAVDSFVKDDEQFDDLTMMCVEYKG